MFIRWQMVYALQWGGGMRIDYLGCGARWPGHDELLLLAFGA